MPRAANARAGAGRYHRQPLVPSDIAGGAPAATLQQAAAFAWQEFIALNWPALAGRRDPPDPSQKFGSGNGTPTIGETPGTGGTPLVWQTFRSKVEIFNLTSSDVPPGYTPSGPSYGYNTPNPTYVYATREIAACQTASSTPAWINLDETTQIELIRCSPAGLPRAAATTPRPSSSVSPSRPIRSSIPYIAANKFSSAGQEDEHGAEQRESLYGEPAGRAHPALHQFSSGNRRDEKRVAAAHLGRYSFAFPRAGTVRFYEHKGPGNAPCYFEEQWGLIALHIIQKTPTAPAFIYATFEQAENIKQPNGTAVEDQDGKVVDPIWALRRPRRRCRTKTHRPIRR